MQQIRRQLTMFVSPEAKVIEDIRAEFNPLQYALIPAHVTLCRENEIEPLQNLLPKLRSLKWNKPLMITFDKIERVDNGKGVLLPAKKANDKFDELRALILQDSGIKPQMHSAHITLMHPRNSLCTNEIFDRISSCKLPSVLYFDKISLIEQINGGKWAVIEEF